MSWVALGWVGLEEAQCGHRPLTNTFPPPPQMWMNAMLEGVAVPSAVSTLWVVTGANVRRGTAHLWTGSSACPREGTPGWPQIPPEVNSPPALPLLLSLGEQVGGAWGGGHQPVGLCWAWRGAVDQRPDLAEVGSSPQEGRVVASLGHVGRLLGASSQPKGEEGPALGVLCVSPRRQPGDAAPVLVTGHYYFWYAL